MSFNVSRDLYLFEDKKEIFEFKVSCLGFFRLLGSFQDSLISQLFLIFVKGRFAEGKSASGDVLK